MCQCPYIVINISPHKPRDPIILQLQKEAREKIMDDKGKVKFKNLKYSLKDLFENTPFFEQPVPMYDIYEPPDEEDIFFKMQKSREEYMKKNGGDQMLKDQSAGHNIQLEWVNKNMWHYIKQLVFNKKL